MTTWIASALHRAIDTLSDSGHAGIASDLRRLVETPAVTGLALYRSQHLAGLAEALDDCETMADLRSMIREIAAALDVSHCTVHVIRERSTAFYDTKVITTFPAEWVAQYVARRYSTIDPIIAHCRRGPGTFFWDLQKASNDPVTRHFIQFAIANGIGPSGITCVADTAYGSTIAVSLASTCTQGIFREAFQERLSDFAQIAAVITDVFSELACELNDAPCGVSDDQLKVLRALASGRPLSEIESISVVQFGSFRTLEKSILQSFGAKTLTQAAAIASSRGLLEDLPYFAEDVFLELNADPPLVTAVEPA
jgi:hypothetical protein